MKNCKILVISNACFSQTDSNGRTLAKLLSSFKPFELSQFFVYGNPDYNVCNNYYQVTDGDALQSFIKQRSFGGIPESIDNTVLKNTIKRNRKTPLNMLLRELAWKKGKWHSSELDGWIKSIDPNYILLSLADNIFLIDLAIRIAEKYNIKIFAFSTEEYYFKDYNYISKRPSMFYLLFRRKLKKTYKKVEKYIVRGIFNTPMLMERFSQTFNFPCEYVLPKSDIHFIENSRLPKNKEISICYLGNLGLNRHKALMQIADELQKILPGNKINVYGKIPDKIKTEFLKHPYISYNGFVDYSEVVQIMHESTLLLHAEYNNEFYNRDLKYAFSTKIADSICCGTPLLLFASSGLAVSSFLANQKCAFVVNEFYDLIDVLRTALTDERERELILSRANITAKNYFRENTQISNIFKSSNYTPVTTCETKINQHSKC